MQLEEVSSGQSTACSVAPGSVPQRRSTREEALEQVSKEPDQVALPFAEAGEPDILSPTLTTPPALQAPRPLRSESYPYCALASIAVISYPEEERDSSSFWPIFSCAVSEMSAASQGLIACHDASLTQEECLERMECGSAGWSWAAGCAQESGHPTGAGRRCWSCP